VSSNLLKLRTHARPRLLAAEALDSLTLVATFSQPMLARPADAPKFRIAGHSVQHLAAAGTTVTLHLDHPLAPGTHTLGVDTTLMDLWMARLLPAFDSADVVYTAPDRDLLYLTRWQRLNDKTALLTFNLPPQPATILPANTSLTPVGRVVTLRPEASDPTTLFVEVADAVLGTAGYPVTLRIRNLLGPQGQPMRTHLGDAVTFFESAADLSDVYVYPNPVKGVAFVQGCRFANLTRGATVTIYTKLGQPVRRVVEQGGSGGADWDLRDATGQRVAPGVYLYKVEGTEGQTVEGRLAILE
jgi:hypothetical protein